jgi:superfamily II DNA or RNA helicase
MTVAFNFDLPAPARQLRDYQQAYVDAIDSDPNRCVLAVMPTGGGKTDIAAHLIKRTAAEFKSAIFVVHRREIVKQASDRLRQAGVAHGIMMAGEKDRRLDRVQVCSVQTLAARKLRPAADLIIIDEAHHVPARSYLNLIEPYPSARIIGLTATPCRGDGRGLGGVFESMIDLVQVQDLIDKGHLVPTKVYAADPGSLKGVATARGDYVGAQLAAKMDTDRLVGNILVEKFKRAKGLKTIVFASSVGHSVHIRDEFRTFGISAEHIDGKTLKAERDEILARLARGEVEVVTNYGVLTEGWDCPDVGCCVLARPTKQMGLYRQMIGRAIRSAPGKTEAIILDHAGATLRHGFAEDRVEWTLDPDEGAVNATHRQYEKTGKDRFIECSGCGGMREGGKACPCCGFVPPQKPVEYQMREGDLGLLERNGKVQATAYDGETRDRWYAMLLFIAQERGRNPGSAYYRYVEKFGEKPSWPRPAPIEPTPEVLAWDRHCRIKYAKAMAAKARGEAA